MYDFTNLDLLKKKLTNLFILYENIIQTIIKLIKKIKYKLKF